MKFSTLVFNGCVGRRVLMKASGIYRWPQLKNAFELSRLSFQGCTPRSIKRLGELKGRRQIFAGSKTAEGSVRTLWKGLSRCLRNDEILSTFSKLSTVFGFE